MKKLVLTRNNILVEDFPQLPLNFGDIQAQKDLEKFKKNLIETFNDDEIFEKRTREALARVEYSDVKGMSESQFLDELDSW